MGVADRGSAAFHVDDSTQVEVGTDEWLLRSATLLIQAVFEAFGYPSVLRPCLINLEKLVEAGGWRCTGLELHGQGARCHCGHGRDDHLAPS